MFIIWLLHNLSYKYNFFQIIINNYQKASKHFQKTKIEVNLDLFAEQIRNLDMQKKISKVWFIKSALNPKKKKKSSIKPLDLYFYYDQPGYLEKKRYYKKSKHISKNFLQRFQNWINKL